MILTLTDTQAEEAVDLARILSSWTDTDLGEEFDTDMILRVLKAGNNLEVTR